MSSHSSQAPASGSLAPTSSAGHQWGTSRSMNTASESSALGSTTATSPRPPSLGIFVASSSPVQLESIEDLRMWLRQDSPVPPSPPLARDSEGTILETCGQRPPTAFAWYDPATSCWRIPQGSLLAGTSDEYSATWPRSGTMRDGIASRHRPSAPLTRGTGPGSSPHTEEFPTPSATTYGSSGNGAGGNAASRGRPSLESMAKRSLWPTPTAQNYGSNRGGGSGRVGRWCPSLRRLVGGPLNPGWVEWLMGCPPGWTDLEPLATAKFQEWCRSHGIY